MKRLLVPLLAALLCLGAAAKPDPREASFLASAQLNADAKVRYLDEKGKPLGFDAFFAAVLKGRGFGYQHEGRVEATFRLEPLKPAATATTTAHRPAERQLQAGEVFPGFALPSTKGTRVTGAALRGRLTLVNFFFAECVPCIAEIPALNAYARHHPEVQVLAVTFDDLATAKSFARQRGLQWPILADAQALINATGVTGYPTFALVGADGKVRAMAQTATIAGKHKKLDVAALSLWVAANRKRPI